jgi:hypothetical protein
MLIRLAASQRRDLLAVLCSLLGVLLLCGVARSSRQLPCRAQRQSIGVLRWQHVR